MSNNNNYTNVSNTSLSASAIISSMTGDSIKAILFDMYTSNNNIVRISDSNIPFTVNMFVQSVIGVLTFVSDMNSGDLQYNASLGPDTVETAGSYIKLFNLDSLSKRITLNVRATGDKVWLGNLVIGNSSGTTNYVTTSSSSEPNVVYSMTTLFTNNIDPGTPHTIEVYATNLTPGAESVRFNIY
jgi:hypothetical protein